jgi:hypothetical protein
MPGSLVPIGTETEGFWGVKVTTFSSFTEPDMTSRTSTGSLGKVNFPLGSAKCSITEVFVAVGTCCGKGENWRVTGETWAKAVGHEQAITTNMNKLARADIGAISPSSPSFNVGLPDAAKASNEEQE